MIEEAEGKLEKVGEMRRQGYRRRDTRRGKIRSTLIGTPNASGQPDGGQMPGGSNTG